MLKNLFNRIKSQKQSTIKNSQEEKILKKIENDKQKSDYGEIMAPQKLEVLKSNLCKQAKSENVTVQNEIQKVRYWRNDDIPDIFTRILSCPISYFNLLPHSQRKVKEINLLKDKYPEYLEFMKPLLQQQLSTYNHILINHYPKGIGIMHHFDGPLYNDRVVVLSLGGPVIISFQSGYSKQTQNMKILLEDKSFHIFQQNAYTKYLHGIEDKKIDVFTFTLFSTSETNKLGQKDKFIKLKNYFSEKTYLVSQCSINNLFQCHSMLKLIEKHLKFLVFEIPSQEQKNYCIEFCQNKGIHTLKGCFIFINDLETQGTQNEQKNVEKWKWKIQIERQQRISITIRQKYQNSSNS